MILSSIILKLETSMSFVYEKGVLFLSVIILSEFVGFSVFSNPDEK